MARPRLWIYRARLDKPSRKRKGQRPLAKLSARGQTSEGETDGSVSTLPSTQILCIGAALWDVIAQTERPLKPGYDVPGRIRRRMGGVALNVALALVAGGARPSLLSYIGRDAEGEALVAAIAAAGIDVGYLLRGAAPTDAYVAVERASGDVFVAVADCAALEREGEALLAPLRDGRLPVQPGSIAVIDGNLPEQVLRALMDLPGLRAATLACVPASPGKALRLRAVLPGGRAMVYVNRREAELIAETRFQSAEAAAKALVAAGAARAIVTDGPHAAADNSARGLWLATPPKTLSVSTTGAGDVFLAHHLGAEAAGATPAVALSRAVAAAARHVAGGATEIGAPT